MQYWKPTNQDLPFHVCLYAGFQTARMRGVDCVVAPYEADAQLAFLNKSGIAQAVITEDSDLLAFGCKKVPVQCAIYKKSDCLETRY